MEVTQTESLLSAANALTAPADKVVTAKRVAIAFLNIFFIITIPFDYTITSKLVFFNIQ